MKLSTRINILRVRFSRIRRYQWLTRQCQRSSKISMLKRANKTLKAILKIRLNKVWGDCYRKMEEFEQKEKIIKTKLDVISMTLEKMIEYADLESSDVDEIAELKKYVAKYEMKYEEYASTAYSFYLSVRKIERMEYDLACC